MLIFDSLPGELEELWNAWGMITLALVSFTLQIVLTLLGSRRRYIPGIQIRFIVWLAYLLSGSVVKIIMGKLTTIEVRDTEKQNITIELMALLAPLLLVQIGNPDTITAYSIEDNRLGLRQLLSLLFQVGIVVYILIRCWTNSPLSFLYLPTFLAGIIKYGESVWALKSALWNSGLTIADLAQEENALSLFKKLSEDIPDLELILKAYYRFNCLKPHLENCYQPFYESLSWMSIDAYSAEDVFQITDSELGFMYDALYTKAPIIYNWIGCILRIVSLASLVFTLFGFTILFREGFISHTDAGFTYSMLIGAIILEVYQITLLPFSDWAIIEMIKHYDMPFVMPCLRVLAPRSYKWKRWSNSLAQFNLVDFCLRDEQFKFGGILKFHGMDMKIRKCKSKTRVDFPKELKELMVQEMKEIDIERGSKPITQRGQWALQRYGCLDHDFKWSIKRDFDKSITIWHIATDICYRSDNAQYDTTNTQIEMCRLLSNYMMYLLAIRPHMLCSTTAKIIIEHTSTKLSTFLRARPSTIKDEYEACRILRTEELRKESDANRKNETMVTSKWHVLKDAQRLARNLLDRENRWLIISSVWMEMLCYAASNCPVDHHSEQLRRGGGLITHVWLLLAHKTDKFSTSD